MVRITARDDEPVARKTAIVAEFASIDRMNRLKADYSSAGTKDEVGCVLTVEPEKTKYEPDRRAWAVVRAP